MSRTIQIADEVRFTIREIDKLKDKCVDEIYSLLNSNGVEELTIGTIEDNEFVIGVLDDTDADYYELKVLITKIYFNDNYLYIDTISTNDLGITDTTNLTYDTFLTLDTYLNLMLYVSNHCLNLQSEKF